MRRKIVSGILAAATVLPLASCAKSIDEDLTTENAILSPGQMPEQAARIISEDTVWFDDMSVPMEGIGPGWNFKDIYSSSDSCLINMFNIDDPNYRYVVFSYDGTLKNEFDIEAGGVYFDTGCTNINGDWIVFFSDGEKYYKFDLADSEAALPQEYEFDFLDDNEHLITVDYSGERTILFTQCYNSSLNNNIGRLYFLSDELEIEYSYDLGELLPDYHYPYYYDMYCMGDGKYLASIAFAEFYGFLYIDLATDTFQTLEEDSWIYGAGYNEYFSNGENTYSITKDGIARIDFDRQSFVDIFDYNSCFANSTLLSESGILYIDDDKVILGTENNVNTAFGAVGDNYEMTILSRADSNPNVGKTILTVANINYNYIIPFYISEAISTFNRSNEDYYLYLIEDYSLFDHDSEYFVNLMSRAQAASQMSTELMIDIMSGEGPDILLGASSYSQLNSDDYLSDLRPLLDSNDNITDESYYTNVFDAYTDDGKLYNIPVSFHVSGLYTDTDNIPSGEVGITFDRMEELTDSVNDGFDPMLDSLFTRDEVFLECFANMSDLFISDGVIDLDNEAFRDLAEYCANLPEEKFYNEHRAGVQYEAVSFYFEKYLMLLYEIGNKSYYGIPSYDGRGPAIVLNDSVAVSSTCASTEAAREFIEILLSYDIQSKIAWAVMPSNPVNKTAMGDYIDDMIDVYNRDAGSNGGQVITSDIGEGYLNMLSTGDHSSSCDSDILVILHEEIGAYFTGDKTIDQIIPVIEDRAQTVLDERG